MIEGLMPTFTLNSNTQVNSYGFSIATEGLNLARFTANPVMLNQHYNNTDAVLGRWDNLRIEQGDLLADAVFDEADEQALKVKGKVERGFIKGASLGIVFNPAEMQLQPNGTYRLMKAEVMEASLVAVPSSAAAVRLYAADTGLLLTAEQVQLQLAALSNNQVTNILKMQKIVLSALAIQGLALAADYTNEQVAAGIDLLLAENKTLKAQLQAAKDKELEQAKAKAKALVSQAVADGRLTADVQPEFETMAINNYELAAKVIGAMPAKVSLAGQVKPISSPAEVKTVDDFEKLPLDKQLAFKAEKPEAYQALFS
ncbi:MAG TPA: hypothetical protein PKD90_07395 [Phnomibacter sp.]|nr:hypothetical protein [Phnomibacter sp.]